MELGKYMWGLSQWFTNGGNLDTLLGGHLVMYLETVLIVITRGE